MQITHHGAMGGINKSWADDPRSVLDKMRRHDLRAFCKAHCIPFNVAMPATSLVLLISGQGLTGREPAPVLSPQPVQSEPVLPPGPLTNEDILPELPKVATDPFVMTEQETVEVLGKREEAEADLPNISNLKFPRLRKMCTTLDIPWHKTDKRPMLEEKLRGYSA